MSWFLPATVLSGGIGEEISRFGAGRGFLSRFLLVCRVSDGGGESVALLDFARRLKECIGRWRSLDRQ